MEENRPGGTSDKDKSMMNKSSFEADSGSSEKKTKKDNKSPRNMPLIFENPADNQVREQSARQQIENLFVTSEPRTQEEPLSGLDKLFSGSPEKPEEAAITSETVDESPEMMAPDETKEAVQQLAKEHASEVQAELQETEPNSQEEAEALAEAALLENVAATGSVEEGYQRTIDDLELEDSSEEASSDVEVDTDSGPAEADDAEEAATTTAATPATAAGVGGGAAPPVPPVAPTPPVGPAGPIGPVGPGGPSSPNALPFNQNLAPTPAVSNPNTLNTNPNRVKRRAADLLVGGIVGYMIGRRRGRLNSEAKLLPVQNNLEKQVKQLEIDLNEQEEKIRRLAAEQARRQPGKLQSVVRQRAGQEIASQPEVTQPSGEQEVITAVQRGKVENQPERSTIVAPVIERAASRPEDVSRLNKDQLLEVAANIKRDDVSLKTLFETGRLDEEGLRRVIRDYWRGERLETSLGRNMKEVDSLESQDLRDAAAGTAATVAGTALGSVASVGPAVAPAPVMPNSYASPSLPTPQFGSNQSQNQDHTDGYQKAQTVGIAAGLVAGVVTVIVALILFA